MDSNFRDEYHTDNDYVNADENDYYTTNAFKLLGLNAYIIQTLGKIEVLKLVDALKTTWKAGYHPDRNKDISHSKSAKISGTIDKASEYIKHFFDDCKRGMPSSRAYSKKEKAAYERFLQTQIDTHKSDKTVLKYLKSILKINADQNSIFHLSNCKIRIRNTFAAMEEVPSYFIYDANPSLELYLEIDNDGNVISEKSDCKKKLIGAIPKKAIEKIKSDNTRQGKYYKMETYL